MNPWRYVQWTINWTTFRVLAPICPVISSTPVEMWSIACIHRGAGDTRPLHVTVHRTHRGAGDTHTVHSTALYKYLWSLHTLLNPVNRQDTNHNTAAIIRLSRVQNELQFLCLLHTWHNTRNRTCTAGWAICSNVHKYVHWTGLQAT